MTLDILDKLQLDQSSDKLAENVVASNDVGSAPAKVDANVGAAPAIVEAGDESDQEATGAAQVDVGDGPELSAEEREALEDFEAQRDRLRKYSSYGGDMDDITGRTIREKPSSQGPSHVSSRLRKSLSARGRKEQELLVAVERNHAREALKELQRQLPQPDFNLDAKTLRPPPEKLANLDLSARAGKVHLLSASVEQPSSPSRASS